ncbi:iron ABC transporter permease [Rhodococcus sp. X156]|uniref:FecCD family ABC transporter permease n=1 Tax=Rhodococcus sp. X156 TaxID=2499145 RepID=UPI000FDB7AD8|nr:iron ABC transporter permease [Rhodococcus sp. X156]
MSTLKSTVEAGASRSTLRRTGLAVGVLVLLVLSLLSLAVGSRGIPLGTTLQALFSHDPTNDLHLLVVDLRVPRTLLALVVGAALGLAGTIMQALTRNPLAEPGILGINAGAAAAVAIGISALGITTIMGYVWLGFLGAGLAGVAVYVLGRAHDVGTNPVRLVLAGAGIGFVLLALTNMVLINSDETTYDAYRNWNTGSLQGRGWEVLPVVAVVCAVGFVIAFALSRSLDSVALGSDLSTALGISQRRTWILAAVAVLLLSGAATAAAGPIAFVGLAAPHVARLLVGPVHTWLLPYAMLLGALLMLLADVAGRVVIYPGEIGAGVMTAIIGGPFFVVLVRRRKMATL